MSRGSGLTLAPAHSPQDSNQKGRLGGDAELTGIANHSVLARRHADLFRRLGGLPVVPGVLVFRRDPIKGSIHCRRLHVVLLRGLSPMGATTVFVERVDMYGKAHGVQCAGAFFFSHLGWSDTLVRIQAQVLAYPRLVWKDAATPAVFHQHLAPTILAGASVRFFGTTPLGRSAQRINLHFCAHVLFFCVSSSCV